MDVNNEMNGKRNFNEIIEMFKNNKIMLIGSLVVLILLVIGIISLIGAGTSGENKDLKIKFEKGSEINVKEVKSGYVDTKEFTVTNKSDEEQVYNLVWKDVKNTFKTQSDLLYTIKGNGDGAFELGISQIPVADAPVFQDVKIPAGVTHTYKFRITYDKSKASKGEDGSTYTGKLAIEEQVKKESTTVQKPVEPKKDKKREDKKTNKKPVEKKEAIKKEKSNK